MGGCSTDGERGAACWARRLVGIIGTASVRFDTGVTAEVAWFMGTCPSQDVIQTDV